MANAYAPLTPPGSGRFFPPTVPVGLAPPQPLLPTFVPVPVPAAVLSSVQLSGLPSGGLQPGGAQLHPLASAAQAPFSQPPFIGSMASPPLASAAAGAVPTAGVVPTAAMGAAPTVPSLPVSAYVYPMLPLAAAGQHYVSYIYPETFQYGPGARVPVEKKEDSPFFYHDPQFGVSLRYHHPDELDEEWLSLHVGTDQPSPFDGLRHAAFLKAAEEAYEQEMASTYERTWAPAARRVREPDAPDVVKHSGAILL